MHHIIPPSSPRAMGRSAVLWLFGIFTTLLLVGMWGRSVTGDQVTLEESAQAVLESELVNRRLNDWLSEAIVQLSAMTPAQTESMVDTVIASPELDDSIAAVVDATVHAALAPPDQPSVLDLQPAVDRLRPAIERALAQTGLPIDSKELTSSFDDLVFSSSDLQLASSTVSGARTFLTTVVLIGLFGLLSTGGLAVWTAEDRVAQFRTLSWRIALSSFTFAVMLRLGAWAVDPAGGRSPIAAGSAVVLGSNAHVPVIMTIVFTTVGAAASMAVIRRRRKQLPPDTEPTGELPTLVGVG